MTYLRVDIEPAPRSPLGQEYLPRTTMTIDDVRSKLAGLHFSQESLTKDERAILYMAEALLRQVDALSVSGQEEPNG